MPEYKNQHYVPRFYFRNFSTNENEIGIYNLNSEKVYIGSIKGQCSKDYFYGKDKVIEDIYCEIENEIKPIMKNIIDTKGGNSLSNKEIVDLKKYILIQYMRTAKAKSEYDEHFAFMADKFIRAKIEQAAVRKETDLKPEIMDKFKIVDKVALSRLGAYAHTHIILLSDLRGLFLINRTERDFIFSDAPVVFHNAYFNKSTDIGSKDLQSMGLQIFFPINNKILYLITDPVLYKYDISDKGDIPITRKCDIEAINNLQYLYCKQNIYYSSNAQKSYIINFNKSLKRKRPKNYFKTEKTVINEGDTIKERYKMYRVNVNYDLELSFMQLNKFKDIKCGVRNPELIEWAKLIDKQMEDEARELIKMKIIH